MTTKLDFNESVEKPLKLSEGYDLLDIMNEQIENIQNKVGNLQYGVDRLTNTQEYGGDTGDEFRVDNIYDLMGRLKELQIATGEIESCFDRYFIVERAENGR